jgi:hypothetical protein
MSMPVGAVVEIAPGNDGTLPIGLISAAYRASSSIPILLLLRALTPQTIDRVLDPVVASAGIASRGVRYVIAGDADVGSETLRVIEDADLVVATTDRFRETLAARGITFVDPRVSGENLEELLRGPRPVRDA